jgi:flavin reductase (DIM6/NTAB) family NADH-FMN oxidoreductase RutF
MAQRVALAAVEANRLLEPGPVSLVTSVHRSTENVMTAAWVMPISFNPPLIAIAIHPSRLTHENISYSEFFALNVPTAELLNPVHLCGIESGREADKFQRCGLTPVDALTIEAPLIDECVANIECGVIDRVAFGDHDLFIGEPLAVAALDEAFDGRWRIEVDAGQILHHLRADYYATLTKGYQARYGEEEE